MTKNPTTSDIDSAKTQIALYLVIILLALDWLNPVKIFLHVFPQVAPWHVATCSGLLITYVFISEFKSLLYFGVKIFFHSILSIFFKEVQVIGRDNIPPHGPVIFTGNHANQFIDGLSIMCTCQRTISYLVAQKSWDRRIIGDLAWAMGAVPVQRAQDSAIKGIGEVSFHRLAPSQDSVASYLEVRGAGTVFIKQLEPGDKIRVASQTFKVKKIVSNEVLAVETGTSTDHNLTNLPFDILKRVDQSLVYGKVLDKLATNGTIGIFPEGGSHDRTDLLPLKVGVALIAYSITEKTGINVPIVPVGLNYFRGHRFRGRAIVEYGAPTYIDLNTLQSYKQGGQERRKVCNELLERILDSMRSVLVTTPDYETLQLIYAARRLYQRRDHSLSLLEKQDLTRRFAVGYKQLLLGAQGNPPQLWLDIQQRIINYQNELTDLGIRDYQVPALAGEKYHFEGDTLLRELKLLSLTISTFVLFCLALVPSFFLNLPVGLIARTYAEQRRKYALKNSSVKILARDVILSERVLLCIVLVPTLWCIYTLLLIFKTDLDGPTVLFCALSMPVFSYMGIMATEAGMVNLLDLRPYLMRLLPSARRRLAALPAVRKTLQDDLRKFIKQLGPTLGDLYYEKDLNWREIQKKLRKRESFASLPVAAATSASAARKED